MLDEIRFKLSRDFDFIGKPWQHQIAALYHSLAHDHYGLFFEMGCGKSFSSIILARCKMQLEKRRLRVLVVSPVITLDNWATEWTRFSSLKKIVPLHGSSAKCLKTLAAKKDTDVFIINYEKLLNTAKGGLLERLLEWQPEILIVDECHKVKDVKAKRSKAVFALAKVAKYRFALSGTPILNSPMDIFGQLKVLDLGRTFGLNFFDFRRHYFFDRNSGIPASRYFPDWRLKEGALADISAKIAPFSMHVKKSECLDLPPLVRKTISIEMTPPQKKVYTELKADFVSYVNDKACVANLAMVKALRLLQIVSGFVAVEDLDGKNREEISFKPNPKIAALEEIFETTASQHKSIVWCSFRHNYADVAALCRKQGLPYVEIHGDIKDKLKFEAVDRFNNDPSIRVLIGHPGSGGIGINLVSASYSIFFSRSFSLEHDLQAEARNHRGGSEIHEKITRIDLVAKGTIDEYVLAKLSQKQAIGHRILQDLAGFI